MGLVDGVFGFLSQAMAPIVGWLVAKNVYVWIWGLLLSCCGTLLYPAWRSRRQSIKKSLVPAYGWALKAFSLITLGMLVLSALLVWYEHPNALKGSVQDKTPQYLALSDLHLPYYEESLLNSIKALFGLTPSGGSTGLTNALWSKESFSFLVVLGLVGLAQGLFWGTRLMLIGRLRSPMQWGRIITGQRAGWSVIQSYFIFALGGLIVVWSVFHIPLMENLVPWPFNLLFPDGLGTDTDTVRVPIFLPTMAILTGALYLGFLLCAHEDPEEADPEPEPEAAEVVERVVLPKSAWLQHLTETGFSLDYPHYSHERGIELSSNSDTISGEANAENESGVLIEGDVAAHPPFGLAAQHLAPGCDDDVFIAVDSNARQHYWSHQRAFIEAILNARRMEGQHRRRASDRSAEAGTCVLMHVAHMCGKTTAVFEAIVRNYQQKGERALVIYPTAQSADVAHRNFTAMVAASERHHDVRAAFAGESMIEPPPQVYFGSADWLVETLLPHHDEFAKFLINLNLVVFEDVEELSGIRATNLAFVNRRLMRLLSSSAYERKPVMAMTLSANPAELTGAQEYVNWLSGSYDVSERAIRNDTPRKNTFLYRLNRAPGLVDAQGQDYMPPLLQLAWSSHVFLHRYGTEEGGGNEVPPLVHVHSQEMLTQSDWVEPRWVQAALEDVLEPERPTAELGWQLRVSQSDAWVTVREVGLHGFFSLPEKIIHSGLNLAEWQGHVIDDDQVCLVPSLRGRGLLQYLLDEWLRSAATSEQEGMMRASVWDQELRPMGSRLICGEPSTAFVEKHLLAALSERQASREELQDLFLRDWRIDRVIRDLEHRGLLEVTVERELASGRSGELGLIENEYLRVRDSDDIDYTTPLDAVGKTVAFLVAPSGRQGRPLRSIEPAQLLRNWYPGKLFMGGEQRFRVVSEEFGYAFENFQRHRLKMDLSTANRIWVECRVEDTLAFTEPVVARTEFSIERSRGGWLDDEQADVATHDRVAFESYQEQGARPYCVSRVDVSFTHIHHGYYEYADNCVDPVLERTFVRWLGGGLTQQFKCRGILIGLPEDGTNVSTAGLVTFRRMLTAALYALVQIEPDTLEVETFEGQFLEDHVGLACTGGVLLLDPFEASTGIIEALGPSRRRFLLNWFRFVWRWAHHLKGKNDANHAVLWDEIGTMGVRYGDNEIPEPNLNEVISVCESLLGERREITKAPAEILSEVHSVESVPES